MKRQKGFSLIELLIVVAIIGIIAAIAIPALLRARLNANESGTIADLKTVMSANATYQAQTFTKLGYAPAISCLSTPSDAACLGVVGYSTTAPTFIDQVIGSGAPKSGYSRSYMAGTLVTGSAGATEVNGYCYDATPVTPDRTGVRSFAIDESGVVAETRTPPGVSCCIVGPAGQPVININGGTCDAMK